MANFNLKDQLVLKRVTIEHLDQFDELLRYVFQVTNQDLESSGYKKDEELLKDKKPIFQHADVIGWFDGNNLISQLCIYSCQVNIHNRIFEMAGLTGVGTYPEYANLGLMKDLIKTALTKMRENKQWISYLYPYSIPFYRKKGWEIFSEHLTFIIKDTQLPKYSKQPGYVKRVDIDDPIVIKVYDQFAKNNHGSMIRDELAWSEYWRWENEDERTAAIYFDDNQMPQGVMFYWIVDDIFYIKDMFYLNQEARKGLWNFVTAHFSMVDKVKGNIYKHDPIAFQLLDSHIKETIEPYYMARIVDVEQFLKEYPFKTSKIDPFHFVVTDPVAEWNNRIFGVEWKEGKLHISDQEIGDKVEISIQALTSMLMSFRRPDFYYQYEQLVTTEEGLEKLEKIIPYQLPYFSDYF